ARVELPHRPRGAFRGRLKSRNGRRGGDPGHPPAANSLARNLDRCATSSAASASPAMGSVDVARRRTASIRRWAGVCLVVACSAMRPGAQSPPVAVGFPNVPQTPGALLSGLNAPQQGRTAIIAYQDGILFTVPEVPSSQPGADFQVRSWDIRDP